MGRVGRLKLSHPTRARKPIRLPACHPKFGSCGSIVADINNCDTENTHTNTHN